MNDDKKSVDRFYRAAFAAALAALVLAAAIFLIALTS